MTPALRRAVPAQLAIYRAEPMPPTIAPAPVQP